MVDVGVQPADELVMAASGDDHNALRFPRVRNRPLRHEVLEPIRNAILFGQLPVGLRLREAEIAAQMGVSRVPVREALRHLEQEGLVVSSPHRGTTVVGVEEDEVELLYFLRAELEGFCVESLMRHAAAEPVGPLQRLVDAMAVAADAGNLLELAERDVEFHQLIVSGSGRQTITRVWTSMDGPIRARLYRLLNGPFQQELIAYTPGSHQPIVDAIAAGDCGQAVASVKQHILETKKLAEIGLRNGRAT